MLLRALVAGAFCAGLLSACAAVDPVDNRYDNISRSWAKARNESIFLNLIRASYNDPLSFTTVSNVTPSMTNVSGFALPAFSIGPANCLPTTAVATATNAAGAIMGNITTTRTTTCSLGTGLSGAPTGFGNTTASDNLTISSNFSVSTQETSAFYTGFLKPIDLLTVSYFIRQGYPAELLFWLFADSFQLVNPNSPQKPLGYHYAPPDSYGCPREDPSHRCFREWVWIALLSGLTVEEKTIVTKFQSKWDSTTIARFCFSYDARRQAENEMGPAFVARIKRKYMQFSSPSPACGSQWGDPKDQEALITNPQPDTFDFTVAGLRFRVVPRSAYGVFDFLGNLMRMQRDNIGPTPGKAYIPLPPLGEPDEAVIPPVLKTVDGEPPLITVVPAGQGDCFVHTWYLNSDFCVPEEAYTTKRIFSLLAQLIAIQTQASDLSITPVVRTIQ